MLKIGDTVYANHIIGQALFDSPNLPKMLRDTIALLNKLGKNPATIQTIDSQPNKYSITLKIKESYDSSSVPAVMCEAYNSTGTTEGVLKCEFETATQAQFILNQDKVIKFFNLSTQDITAGQLVRLVYNNKNLTIMPIETPQQISDYHGVIGKSISVIRQYDTGNIKLLTISQLMDNDSFLKLNIRGRRR